MTLKKSLILLLAIFAGFAPAVAVEIRMTPETELKSVLKKAQPGDSIVLANGTWKDSELRFEGLIGTAEKPILIRAESQGKVILTGKVRFRVSGKHVIVSGFSFLNPVGSTDVFEFRTHSERHAHHCRITDCSFEQTEPSEAQEKTLWLNVYGTKNRVDHCYFAGKQNQGTTLVVWVDETPGEHRIDHNHFGPRPELGKNGGETIRIGISETSEFNNRAIVEENFFERCNGEGEIISNKSCENIYRHNHFDRCEGALTLRHGHRCIVDGNVFLGHEQNGTGGVRIIGSDHRVTNNYFEELRGDSERSAISLMNGIPDSPLNGYAPVRNAFIAHNTLINCKVSMEFGVSPSKKVSVVPADCQVSHNVFISGKWELFRVPHTPQNFTWVGNKYQSGKTRGAEPVDIECVDIELARGVDGLLRPTSHQSLLTGSETDVKIDIDGKPRQQGIAGCDDAKNTITIRTLTKTTGPTWRQK
ncbi:polysaccharide lyase 6 family protein [Akkermansiaceae bacterium]|nr:polysaccharide lyase 6 family protein [Akkermansiaceae bacterium]